MYMLIPSYVEKKKKQKKKEILSTLKSIHPLKSQNWKEKKNLW